MPPPARLKPSVTATERRFSEPPPQHLYLDTNFILDYLVDTRPRHARVARFLQRVEMQDSTTLYLSSLSELEFLHVIRSEEFRQGLAPDWQRQYKLGQWEQPGVREAYCTGFLKLLQEFLDSFTWAEVALTAAVRTRAVREALTYNLDSHDAVHLASAYGAEVFDFASFDRGFRRVDGLSLWNDGIHGTT
jgi:predicted nucleic acid-binding protein